MKAIKFLTVVLLSVCMVFTMMPLGTLQAMAIDEPQQTEQQDATSSGSEGDKEPGGTQGEGVTDDAKGASDSKGANDGASAEDDDGNLTDTPAVEEEPVAEEPTEPMMKAPSRGLPSGEMGGDWVWIVTGEEDDYTLTFEYQGEENPAPALAIPNDFYSSISEELGDIDGNIKTIDFPDETRSIGSNAFKGVESIETANLSNTNVTAIGASAFQNCTGLKGMKFPASLTSIGASAFEGDTALKTVDFSLLQDNEVTYSDNAAPNPALTIGNRAFAGSGVTSVSLPDQLNQVGSEVFLNCKDLKNADMPAFSYLPMNSTTGVSMFSGCKDLEDLTFRSVEERKHYYNSNNTYLNKLPSNVINGCTSLKTLDMSGYKGQRKDTFQIQNIFTGSNLSSLQQLILPVEPEKMFTINSTFTGKGGLSSLSVIKNPESITNLGTNAFRNTGISSADMSGWTGITSIPAKAFENCAELTTAVIPENVTTIGNMAFANDPKLKEVEIKAKELTAVGNNIFEGDDALKTLTIGSEVDKLNGNIFSNIGSDTDVIFKGENLLSITKPTVTGSQLPLRNLDGDYFADANGVLYKLDEDGTATLAYIPPGLTSYTVPASIHTPDGKDYSVDTVGAYCCAMADDLRALTFADPSKVSIAGAAFKGWTTSDDADGKTINGKTFITPAEWKNVSTVCSYPLKEGSSAAQRVPDIEEIIPGTDPGTEIIKTIIMPDGKTPGEDGIYHYKTGETAAYGIAINNKDNVVMEKVVRIYFEFSNDGYQMVKFSEGTQYLVDNAGNEIPMKVVKTSEPNVWYYEISDIKPGRTVAFNDGSIYPSPTTAGGTLRMWTETLTQEQAEALEGKVVNPGKYIEYEWSTDPVGRDLAKTKSNVYGQGNPKIITSSDGQLYIANLMFQITERNHESPATSAGADYIKTIVYEDVLELPEGIFWDPDVLAAIQKGQASASGSDDGWFVSASTSSVAFNESTSRSVYPLNVRLNGTTRTIAYLYSPSHSASNLTDMTPTVVTDESGKETVKIRWRVNNPYTSSQFPVSTYYIRYGNNVLCADSEAVNAGMGDKDDGAVELFTVHNNVDETRYYNYSPKQTASAEADAGVDGSAGFTASKSVASNYQALGGNPVYMYVNMQNTGIVDLTRWGSPTGEQDEHGRQVRNGNLMSDTLSYLAYITPADIEKMLAAKATAGTGSNSQEYNVGDWLTITINSASLFDPALYAPTEGKDQSEKYSTTNMTAVGDNSYRNYQNAKFVITKNNGVIEVTLSGDSISANNKTYTVGEGQDFVSVKALFDSLGYMPTHDTTYSMSWNIGDDSFVLHPAQTMRIDILSSMKTTPMLLTQDTSGYRRDTYSSSSNPYSNFRFSNTATVRSQIGDRTPSYSYLYWQHELSVSKGATLEGSTSTSFTEGSVVDYYISGTNTNGKAYDSMSMHDRMTGAQVLLVPVSLNPNLKAADGSNLEKFTSRGVEYWLLNKPGTYTNVHVGRNTKDNTATTQNYTAEKIIVDTSGNGVTTEIHWQPIENWGGTSSANYIYYKSLVGTEHSGATSTSSNPQTLSYPVSNRAWLGDHQGHRLYTTRSDGYNVTMYSFSKRIIADEGAKDGTDPANMLLTNSHIKPGQTVTYQMQLNNVTDKSETFTGDRLRDQLPNTYGVFAWTRGDDETEANVTNLRYYGTNGVTISTNKGSVDTHGGINAANDDYWRIDKNDAGNIYNVRWNGDFKITIPARGNVKILMDVTYPESNEDDSTWDQYVAANKGAFIYNYFYVDNNNSSVYHEMESEGYPVLYKGVFNTGITTKYMSSGSRYNRYTTSKSRLKYSNGPDNNSASGDSLKASTITYYTVIYNGSYDRMYLSDIQDQLPRGFKFNGLVNTSANTTSTSNTSSSYTVYTGYSSSTVNNLYNTEYASSKLLSLSNANDSRDNNTIKYINARVTATAVNGEDGKQRLTFQLSNYSSSYGSGGLKRDAAIDKYYLAPGEAIRFGYNVEIGSYANTDDLATNTAAMPYYDYYGTDFDLNVPDEEGNGGVRRSIAAVSGINVNNDGGCETMTADQVSAKYGFDISKYSGEKYNDHMGGNWLVSYVDVTRSDIVPGIQKTVGGTTTRTNDPVQGSTSDGQYGATGGTTNSVYGTAYQGGCVTKDIVNWRVRVYNEGGKGDDDVHQMMTNYTLVDTMSEPYGFTGRVSFDTYTAGGTRSTATTNFLFTLGKRGENDRTVKIANGNNSNPGNTLTIGSADDPSDDEANWYTFGTGNRAGKVRIERDSEGKETMTIVLEGPDYSVPAGFYNEFRLHTQYTKEKDQVLSAGKFNDAVVYPQQDYDPAKVAQGRARTVEEEDDEGNIETKNNGVQSGASIMLTLGYNTESWKVVTQKSNTGNNAQSESSNNYINLPEKTEPFRYDLYMIAPESKMSRVVFIDDLPQEGDHSAFVAQDKRNSDYTVSFDENDPEFEVALAPSKGGTQKVLEKDKYRLFVSTKTEFKDSDWIADSEGYNTGWTDITDYTDDQLKAVLKTARSVRVQIDDPKALDPTTAREDLLMSYKSQIRVSFNAKTNDKTAKPGEYAWNSFGYKYDVALGSTTISLDAQPLKVGVRFPSAPVLEKKLTEEVTETVEITDEETGETTTEEKTSIVEHKTIRDENFRFIVYEGEPIPSLDDVSGKTDAEIAEILEGAERKYVYVPYTVEAGKSSAEKGLWEIDYCSKYDDGAFSDDEENLWKWKTAEKYTVLELSIENKYVYKLQSISINGRTEEGNNKVFTNSNETKIQLVGENRYSPANLILTKKMPTRVDTSVSEDAPTNSTAVFRVVAVDKDDPTKKVYENTVGIDFNNETGASEMRILNDIPVGTVITVTEAYSGNYEPKEKSVTLDESKIEIYPMDGQIKELRGKPVWTFEFENELKDNDFGSGIVNQYECKDGNVTYKENKPAEPKPDPADPQE